MLLDTIEMLAFPPILRLVQRWAGRGGSKEVDPHQLTVSGTSLAKIANVKELFPP